jgi:CelD/BcsL family acetyltransferase involved in cellulose biosynthesis
MSTILRTEIEKTSPDTDRGDLTLISRPEEFDALRNDWNLLLQECDASIYQTFEWQSTWWKHFREEDTQLHILVLRREGQLVGIAPFYIEKTRTFGFIPIRILAFLGQGLSDYLDCLFARGHEPYCAQLVADYLFRHGSLFDVIHLEDSTDRLPNHALLLAALRQRGFMGEHFINEYCPRTTLLSDWESTLASFKIDNRREIRRRTRNLHKNFTVEYEVITEERDVSAGMEAFMELHQHRWTNDGHAGVFSDSRTAAFHIEVAREFARQGWLYLAFLRANDERVAALYCFMYGNDLAIYLTGSSNRSKAYKYSPSRVLTAYCMEQAVLLGKKTCDFMRGTEPYKYELDAKDIPNWAMLLYSPHSKKPQLRYKVDLLARSLKRRTARERFLLRLVAENHGLLSRTMWQHVSMRLKQTFVEGSVKVKDPARAINVRPKSSGQSVKIGEEQTSATGEE